VAQQKGLWIFERIAKNSDKNALANNKGVDIFAQEKCRLQFEQKRSQEIEGHFGIRYKNVEHASAVPIHNLATLRAIEGWKRSK
jgi:hypothetical protein